MEVVFKFDALPQNLDELKALPEAALSTPFMAAALTVASLCRYETNQEEAIAMLNYLRGPQPMSILDLQRLKDRLIGKGHVPRSYFAGTSPKNNYEPSVPYTITIFDNAYSYEEASYARLNIQSSGADAARPVTLREKDSQWFLWDNTLMSDIRKPAIEDPWA